MFDVLVPLLHRRHRLDKELVQQVIGAVYKV